MTLQIALLGSDGVLTASDTRVITSDRAEVDPQIFDDEDKVTVSSDGTVVVAWSQNKPSKAFIVQLAEIFREQWGSLGLLLSSSRHLWEKEKEGRPGDPVDCDFIIAKSQKRQIYRVLFSREKHVEIIPNTESHMPVIAGQKTNSACFFTQAYHPTKLLPVENLIRWAAHYILMGAKVNSAGIGGLTIHVSKNGGVFQGLTEEQIRQLVSESEDLDRQISGFLFSAFSIPDLS